MRLTLILFDVLSTGLICSYVGSISFGLSQNVNDKITANSAKRVLSSIVR